MDFSHSVNPAWAAAGPEAQVLPTVTGEDQHAWLGWKLSFWWLKMRRIPTLVPPLSPPAIGEMLAAVLLPLPLSLSLPYTHTYTLITSSLPDSLRFLSLSFLSPAPFPSDCQTRCQRSISGCLRRNLRVFSFSLHTLTHTHTRAQQKFTPAHVT